MARLYHSFRKARLGELLSVCFPCPPPFVIWLRDFGLDQELDYFDAIERISEETDIYERERKIDKFRWDWLDENTVFDYFNIEYLFAYLCKLQILERWVQLNAEEGERVFREIIANMKKEVKVPDEE